MQTLKTALLNDFAIKNIGLSALMQNYLKERKALRKKFEQRKKKLKELGFKEMSKDEKHRRLARVLRSN